MTEGDVTLFSGHPPIKSALAIEGEPPPIDREARDRLRTRGELGAN